MYRRNDLMFKAFITIGLILSIGAFFGCSSKSSSDDSTSGSITMTVSASPTVVQKGNSSVVEAAVTSGGSALSDQRVIFTVVPANAGNFFPSDTVTGADGVAATVFTAITSGPATISAQVATLSLTNTAGVTVTEAAQESSGNVNLSVTPTLLLANGSDTSRITIAVSDQVGTPAPDSTLVKITAGEKFVDIDGNGYWSAGIDSLVYDANANGVWDAIGIVPSTAYTSGGNGLVTINYISSNDAGTVYILTTVDDNGITGWAETSLQQNPNAAINSIYLNADTLSLSVKQTGGIETGILHAVCFDINGNPVPEGLMVSFVITDGPGGGERLGNVGTGPYVAYTNSQGDATASIHSGTISGTMRIRAFADTVMSNATHMLIAAGPPETITVGADECNVPNWNTVNYRNGITALVNDRYNNPVNDSTVVYFTVDEGVVLSHETRTMNGEGIATSIWMSAAGNVDTADGRVWVFAETSGGTVRDSVMFYNTTWPETYSIFNLPASMPADGKPKGDITVQGYDFNGNPVDGGVIVKGGADYLQVGDGVFQNGCGIAATDIPITSVVLEEDYSITGLTDDGIGAVDVVKFWHPLGGSTTAVVTLTTGAAYRGNSSLDGPTSVSALTPILDFYVTIKDRSGNPLGDHLILMSSSAGVITPGTGTQRTNSYGEADGFVWTSPDTTVSSVTISFSDNDPGSSLSFSTQVTIEK